MSDIIPKGRVIEVRAVVIVPETATFEEVDEWVNHIIFDQGGISVDNPLLTHGAPFVEEVNWDDSGCYRFTAIRNVEKTDGGIKYSIRRENVLDRRTGVEIAVWKSPDAVRNEALSQ